MYPLSTGDPVKTQEKACPFPVFVPVDKRSSSALLNRPARTSNRQPSGAAGSITGSTQAFLPSLVESMKDDTSVQNGFVEVKFKPISGKEDQAGGVVWRAKDANNYYIARANALEDNVTIYHTIDGRRTEKKRTNMKVATNQWHTLRVDFEGNRFTVTYDGKKAIEWTDDTFKDAGKVGLWTKADSVTLFDDFNYGAK